jgi:hypothetical protein
MDRTSAKLVAFPRRPSLKASRTSLRAPQHSGPRRQNPNCKSQASYCDQSTSNGTWAGAWAALSRAWSRAGIFKSLQWDPDYPCDGPSRPAMLAWAATAHLFCRPRELVLALVDSLPWRRRPTLLALERAEIFQMKRRCKFVEASCVFRRIPLLAMARGRRRSGIA